MSYGCSIVAVVVHKTDGASLSLISVPTETGVKLIFCKEVRRSQKKSVIWVKRKTWPSGAKNALPITAFYSTENEVALYGARQKTI